MALRFACANCGKHHRIGDQYAGRKGRCGRCGHRFVAPGVPKPSGSNVFVSTQPPDPFVPTDPPRARGGVGSTLVIGVLLAIIALFVIVDHRDWIVAALPALAPALPPRVLARPLVEHQPVAAPALPPEGLVRPLVAPQPVAAPVITARPANPRPEARINVDPIINDPRPAQIKAVDRYLHRYAGDPQAVEIVDWKAPVQYDGSSEEPPSDEAVYIAWRGRNSLGALVVSPLLVFFRKGEVVKTESNADGAYFHARVSWIYREGNNNPIGNALHDLANQPDTGKRATPR